MEIELVNYITWLVYTDNYNKYNLYYLLICVKMNNKITL